MKKQGINIRTGAMATILLAALVSGVSSPPKVVYKEKKVVVEKERIVQAGIGSLNRENVMKYLKELNVKFPHIVLAQAIIESGNFTSKICKENHNLFGMREARLRISNNLGTKRGHAAYSNWKESVVDYALYQATYLSRCKTEAEYYAYLARSYAAGPHYSVTVKKLADSLKE